MVEIGRVFKTKRGPGVVIRGKNGIPPERIFDDVSRLLSDFYFDRDLVVATSPYNPSMRRYVFSVYDPEKIQVEMIYHRDQNDSRIILGLETRVTSAPPLGEVSIIPQPLQVRWRFVKEWDFPHAPHEVRTEQFLAYFNFGERLGMRAERYSEQQRDEFYTLLARRLHL